MGLVNEEKHSRHQTTSNFLGSGPLSTRALCANPALLSRLVQQKEEKETLPPAPKRVKSALLNTSKQSDRPQLYLPLEPKESKKTSSKRDLDEYDDLNDDSKPAPATKSLKTASTSTAGKSPLQQPQHSHQKSQPLSQKQQQPRLLSPHSGTSAAVNRKPHTALTHGASLLAGGRGGIPHGSKSTGNAQQSASKGSLHNPGRVVGSSNGAGQVAGFRPSNGSTQGLQGKQSSAGQRLQGTGARMPMQAERQNSSGQPRRAGNSYSGEDSEGISEDDGDESWRREMRAVTGYDPSRYASEPADDRSMVVGWRQLQAEEKRSARTARDEDDEAEKEEARHRADKIKKKEARQKEKRKAGGKAGASHHPLFMD